MSSQNKETVKRLFHEIMNDRKMDLIDQVISPDYVNHGFPNAPRGTAGFQAIIQQFTSSFPDMQITVEEIIGEGNSVATRGFWTGTHKGDFMGVGATGKKVKISYIDFWLLKNGLGVENWVQMDIAGLMQQLGANG